MAISSRLRRETHAARPDQTRGGRLKAPEGAPSRSMEWLSGPPKAQPWSSTDRRWHGHEPEHNPARNELQEPPSRAMAAQRLLFMSSRMLSGQPLPGTEVPALTPGNVRCKGFLVHCDQLRVGSVVKAAYHKLPDAQSPIASMLLSGDTVMPFGNKPPSMPLRKTPSRTC